MGARVAITFAKTRTRLSAAMTALAVLAGCGNDPTANAVDFDVLKSIFQRQGDAPAPPTGQQVSNALAGTEGPLELLTREDTKGWALMLRIERNGRFETFGSSDRRTVTMRNGIISGTRGLGGDLMSSDLTQVSALISGREPGRGTRVMRFLTGADKIRELRFDCTVNVGERMPVKAGAVDTSARRVTETCTSGDMKISNLYLVDRQGWSVSSKQWIGEMNGYMLTQSLRR
jgi:hypothetical protein